MQQALSKAILTPYSIAISKTDSISRAPALEEFMPPNNVPAVMELLGNPRDF